MHGLWEACFLKGHSWTLFYQWRDICRQFVVLLYAGMAPQTVIGLHSVWVRDVSGTHRFWIGNIYVDPPCAIRRDVGVDSVLNQPWIWWRHQMALCAGNLRRHRAHYDVIVMIGVRLADICPTHNWFKTSKRCTIGGRIKTDTSQNASDKTDTTAIYNRQTTDD